MLSRVLAAVALISVSSGCSDDPEGSPPPDPPDAGAALDAAPGADGEPRPPVPDSSVLPPLYDAGPAPANTTCSAPQDLTLSGGKVTVNGDTFAALNEFDSNITCSSPLGPYPGPQLYYRVHLEPGTYKLTLEPDKVDLALYVFPASTSCDAAAINAACTDQLRDTPDPKPYAGKTEAMLLQVTQDGDWMVVVDSYNELEKGLFGLTIETFTPPTNTTCSTASPLTPGQPVTGDTIGAGDEFATVHCGEAPSPPSTKVPYFVGPQLYYRASLTQGTTYRVNLRPTFIARLYLFHAASASCTPGAIEAACSSKSGKGDVIGVTMDGNGELLFTPDQGGDHIIVVDSTSPVFYGSFTLFFAEQSTATLTAPLSLDFEQSGGGLSGTADWEHGAINFGAGPACTLGTKTFGVAPSAGHSGTGMWGTVLNDCYNALANNSKVDDKQGTCTNLSPSDDSVLGFKVTLPASWSSAKLSYWSWEDLNQPFDWAEIRVDNKVAWQLCEMTYTQPTAWKQRTIDLTAHVGQTVEIGFHFMASAFVNYAGWYIDDLTVSGS